jgi:hypothetical protein
MSEYPTNYSILLRGILSHALIQSLMVPSVFIPLNVNTIELSLRTPSFRLQGDSKDSWIGRRSVLDPPMNLTDLSSDIKKAQSGIVCDRFRCSSQAQHTRPIATSKLRPDSGDSSGCRQISASSSLNDQRIVLADQSVAAIAFSICPLCLSNI